VRRGSGVPLGSPAEDYVLLLALATCLLAADFEKDVRPILAKRCLKCHGAEEQLAGVRLDRLTADLGGGD